MESKELSKFHEFVGEQLNNCEFNITPEEVLDRWREHKETIASIQGGLDDVEAGRNTATLLRVNEP